MPRRRNHSHVQPKRRVRTGCIPCRTHKIKCDEHKPQCGQCCRKNRRCETITTLKWETDYHSKGLAFGRAGIWTKSQVNGRRLSASSDCSSEIEFVPRLPHIHPYSFINSTVDSEDNLTILDAVDNLEPLRVHQENHELVSSDGPTCTSSLSFWLHGERVQSDPGRPVSPLSSLPQLSYTHANLLLPYFLEYVCPLTVPALSHASPFAAIILPYAISESSIVLDSLLAVAACHRSRSDRSFESMALQFNHRILRHIRFRLSTEPVGQVSADPEILVLMMILCLFEIVHQNDKNWVVHLKASRELIRLRRQNPVSQASSRGDLELVDFSEKFFAYQDVIGRTGCGEQPIFGRDFWTSDSVQCDVWLGCSPQLVRILCAITELSRQHSTDPTIEADACFQMEAARLEAQLGGLRQKTLGNQSNVLLQSAELKRLCAEVYLYCALYGANPSTAHVKERIGRILHLVSGLLEAGVKSGLTWPVFVAAVELDPLDKLVVRTSHDGHEIHAEWFVMHALDSLCNSMANIKRTRSVIEKVWQRREIEIYNSFTNPDFDLRNDWERLVAPVCGNMSLA